MHAIQKEFSLYRNTYVHGKAEKLLEYAKRYFGDSLLLKLGRAGTGNRFDALIENVFSMHVNLPIYLHFLNSLRGNPALAASILDASVYHRLVCREIQAAIHCRAMFWLLIFEPFRLMVNGTKKVLSSDIQIYDMSIMADMLFRELNLLIDSEEARDDFINGINGNILHLFQVTEFPCLSDFYAKRNKKTKKSLDGKTVINVKDYVWRRVFGLSDDETLKIELKKFVKTFAIGCRISLTRHATKFLSSTNGIYRFSNWTPEWRSLMQGIELNNVQHGESPFSSLDSTDKIYQNADIDTVAGVVFAMHNHPFDGNKDKNISPFTEDFSDGTLELIVQTVNRQTKHYRKERKEAIAIQKAKRDQVQEENAIAAKAKMIAKQLRVIAYFNLQRVESMGEIERIFSTSQSRLSSNKSVRCDFLKEQIRAFTEGFSLPHPYKRPFTKRGDPSVGSEGDFKQRLQDIFDLRTTSPSLFVIADAPETIAADLKHTLETHVTESALADNEELRQSLLKQTYGFYQNYAPILLRPWEDVKPWQWSSSPLTPLQQTFKRGQLFMLQIGQSLPLERCICHGLMYISSLQDYEVLYQLYHRNNVPLVTHLGDPQLKASHLNLTVLPSGYTVVQWRLV